MQKNYQVLLSDLSQNYAILIMICPNLSTIIRYVCVFILYMSILYV